MKKITTIICMAVLLVLCSNYSLTAQVQTVGMFTHLSGSEDDGYVLFAPYTADTTYLIDKCGRLIHTWASEYMPGLDVYLLPDGTLLRAGHYPNPVFDPSGLSAGGVIERYDWEGHLLWHYVYSNAMETQNHDICYLPNGNILLAVWEVISDSEALANGRNPGYLGTSIWSAKVVEIQPVGTDSANIVWQWRVWDHLVQDYDATKPNYGVIARHPELLNLNYVNVPAYHPTETDWLHLNAVTYNPALDQIMISAHDIDEIWIIDHSTDSLTAAGHTGGRYGKGGDFLYRWGNPLAYQRGTSLDTKLFQQHDPEWITSGRYANQIMIFNNGLGRPGGNASSVDIINPPIDSSGHYTIDSIAAFGPDTLSWTYENPIRGDFYSAFMGSSQVLPNGDFLICQAMQGVFFEIDSSKNIVWKYINPVDSGRPAVQGATVTNNATYRCSFYPAIYAGFSDHILPPGVLPIEQHPLPSTCDAVSLGAVSTNNANDNVVLLPNPSSTTVTIMADALKNIRLMDVTGKILADIAPGNQTQVDINVSSLADGMYIVCVNNTQYKRLVVQH